jgi:hypothetical protein
MRGKVVNENSSQTLEKTYCLKNKWTVAGLRI